MNERILCVDDDANILQAYQRALRKRFAIEIAISGAEGLDAVRDSGPYAVVVADMRMPEMNGVQFLAAVRQIAPQTVRMMLTGNADQQTALEAVNEGQIFRFLNKPCPPEQFARTLEAGLEQYRLVTAERELLSKTLFGSIKVLSEVLGMVNPAAFGRASRVHRLVGRLCGDLNVGRGWLIEIAAMLSQIGCLVVPEETLRKLSQRQPLTRVEAEQIADHPRVARDLLANIPRMEEIAQIIFRQNENCEGVPAADDAALGARILKAALDWDTLETQGLTPELAMAEINDRQSQYDPNVLAALRRVHQIAKVRVVRRVRLDELVDGAMLADDVKSINGTLLCAKGQEVSSWLRSRLNNYAATVGVQVPIKVFLPLAESENAAEAAGPGKEAPRDPELEDWLEHGVRG